jgi:hypothetical protein
MTEGIIMSSYPSLKSSRRLARCDKPRRSTFCSRMWKSSTRVIRASMSSCGKSPFRDDLLYAANTGTRTDTLCVLQSPEGWRT